MFLKQINPANTPKPAAPSRKATPSVISADMNILGNIISEGTLDFDGIIDGNIRCGTLVLRASGRVNGEVHAENVQVYGKVKGLIKAKSVHLFSSCSVEGVIMHETISIEDGATIDGKFKRTNKIAAALPASAMPLSAGNDGELPANMDEEFFDVDPNEDNDEAPRMLENIRLIAG